MNPCPYATVKPLSWPIAVFVGVPLFIYMIIGASLYFVYRSIAGLTVFGIDQLRTCRPFNRIALLRARF